MPAQDVDARLDLIRFAVSHTIDPDVTHPERYVELAQALCDRRDLPVRELLTAANVRLLRLQAAEAFDELAERHGWTTP